MLAGTEGAVEDLARLLPDDDDGVRRRRVTDRIKWRYRATKARKLVPEVAPAIRDAKFAFRKLHRENGGVWKADFDAYAKAHPDGPLAFKKLGVPWNASGIHLLLELQPLQFVHRAIGKLVGRGQQTGKKLASHRKKLHATKLPKDT